MVNSISVNLYEFNLSIKCKHVSIDVNRENQNMQNVFSNVPHAFARALQEMAHAWEEYNRLETSVEQLRIALQALMNHSDTSQVRPEGK